MDVRQARWAEEAGLVEALFREYAGALPVDLSFQGFEDEVASLPGAYARPQGRLLLAAEGSSVAGCVGLRPLVPGVCELKRLYVRLPWRGSGVGWRLASAAVDEARAAGYRCMRLDTLPSMEAAQELYRSLGFTEIAPYRDNPVPGARFLELALRPLELP